MKDDIDNHVIDIERLKERVSLFSSQENIEKWDIGASLSNDASVQVDQGEAKQLKSSQRSSITIRVWNKSGLVGITNTSDTSDKGIKQAIKKANEASSYGSKKEIPDFSPTSKDIIKELKRPIIKGVGIKELLLRLIEAEQRIINSHSSINSVPYNGLSESYYQRIYINSSGAHRDMSCTQAGLYLYPKAEEINRKPRISSSAKISYGIEDLAIDECINEALEKTLSHLNYKPIDTGNYLICFSPESFLQLILAFNNIFNARSILDGVSLTNKDSIGSIISSKCLSISDDGLHTGNIGSFNFDGEGSPTRRIELIKAGVLKNFIHSEYTAREFGVKPTGHAGLGAKVSVAPDWLIIESSGKEDTEDSSLNHMNSKVEFVLVENLKAMHAGVKSTQGSFSLPFDGWLVKNGEKTSIDSATIAGDINYVLNNIVNIEKEAKITLEGVSPHIWVDRLKVTGDL